MDLLLTGKFIAELRKEQGLTQEQLGEKIGVTNKTVSRWETGTYLPPADVLMIMSELFGVSINEILSGKRLTNEEYRQAAEENLIDTVQASSFELKDRISFYKKKWLKAHAAMMIFIGICLVGIFAAGAFFSQIPIVYLSLLLLISAHCWRHNSMMSYIEKHAFDGKGSN